MPTVDKSGVTPYSVRATATIRRSLPTFRSTLLFAAVLVLTLAAANAQQNERRADAVGEKVKKLGPEDVPFLIAVLARPGNQRVPWYSKAGEPGPFTWGFSHPKTAAVLSLGEIGDLRAVPVLECLLRNPPKDFEVFPVNLAHSLYLLTGKSYQYEDNEGRRRPYLPLPLIEEKWRQRSRPDLKPVDGLTADLQIRGPGSPPEGWLGSKSLVLVVSIANHSQQAVEVELSPERFAFSAVGGSGERSTVAASDLPPPQPGDRIETIQVGKTVSRTWTIEKLAQSSLSRSWTTSGIIIRCQYQSPPNRPRNRWRGTELVSNSVSRFYFQSE